MRHEHPAVGAVGAPPLAAGDVPGVADHQLEVVVQVDRGRHVRVVIHELLRRDLAVFLLRVESVQKLSSILYKNVINE